MSHRGVLQLSLALRLSFELGFPLAPLLISPLLGRDIAALRFLLHTGKISAYGLARSTPTSLCAFSQLGWRLLSHHVLLLLLLFLVAATIPVGVTAPPHRIRCRASGASWAGLLLLQTLRARGCTSCARLGARPRASGSAFHGGIVLPQLLCLKPLVPPALVLFAPALGVVYFLGRLRGLGRITLRYVAANRDAGRARARCCPNVATLSRMSISWHSSVPSPSLCRPTALG